MPSSKTPPLSPWYHVVCKSSIHFPNPMSSAPTLVEIQRQSLLQLGLESLLHQLHNPAVVPAVGVLEVLANPCLDVGDLGERVARCLLTGVQLREANAEADLIHVGIWNNVVC